MKVLKWSFVSINRSGAETSPIFVFSSGVRTQGGTAMGPAELQLAERQNNFGRCHFICCTWIHETTASKTTAGSQIQISSCQCCSRIQAWGHIFHFQSLNSKPINYKVMSIFKMYNSFPAKQICWRFWAGGKGLGPTSTGLFTTVLSSRVISLSLCWQNRKHDSPWSFISAGSF